MRRSYNCDKFDDYECSSWYEEGFPGEYVYGDDYFVEDYYLDERWKPIIGFYGYWVSNFGRVYGPGGKKGTGRMLKLVATADGYLKVTLCRKDMRIDKRVNRLVAEAFLYNDNNYPVVMHIDNDRMNNRVDNLAWGTYEENNRWCVICGRHKGTITDEMRKKANEIRRKPVIAINVKTGERTHFISQHEASRILGVSQQHIWGVLNGYRRSTGGYTFEYVDKEEYYD